MDPVNIYIIARKEIRDSLRNRWFAIFAAAFTLLSLGVSYLSRFGSEFYGDAGFGRTAAGLVNLVLLVVPLMGLVISTASLAGERERGTLAYLLAQPINRGEVLIGKYIGLAAALMAALAVGFGISALTIGLSGHGGDVRGYLALVGLTCVLALTMLSTGLLISTLSSRASVANGIAVFGWLGLVFLSDLGLMGGAIVFKLQAGQLFELALINPLQVFKLAVLGTLQASLEVLGPAGLYATQTYGPWLAAIFGGALAAWIVLPFTITYLLFTRRGTP